MCGGVDLFIREKGDVLTTAFGWLWIFWIVKCVCVCAWVFCVEVEISNEVPVRGDIFGRGFWGVVFP